MANEDAKRDGNYVPTMIGVNSLGEIRRAVVDDSGQLAVTLTGGSSSAVKTLVDEQSSALTYVGKAALGTATSAASWQVSRITVAGTLTTIEYAGTGASDQIWDQRATLTYN